MVLFVWKGSPFKVLWVSAYLFLMANFLFSFSGTRLKSFLGSFIHLVTLCCILLEQQAIKIVSNGLNASIYSYLETSGVQSSFLYLNVVHFFNTSVN